MFATKARIDNRKKLLKQQYLIHMSSAAEIGSVVWGTPANFNGFRVLEALHGVYTRRSPRSVARPIARSVTRLIARPIAATIAPCKHAITAATSLNGSQPNFARSLAVSWAGTLCIHFRRLLPRNGILSGAKFTLRPSLVLSYIDSVIARHSSRGVSQTLRR